VAKGFTQREGIDYTEIFFSSLVQGFSQNYNDVGGAL
jgi:hypothetical protein